MFETEKTIHMQKSWQSREPSGIPKEISVLLDDSCYTLASWRKRRRSTFYLLGLMHSVYINVGNETRNIGIKGLESSPRTVRNNYNRPSILSKRNLLLHGFPGKRSKFKVPVWLVPNKVFPQREGNHLLTFLLVAFSLHCPSVSLSGWTLVIGDLT